MKNKYENCEMETMLHRDKSKQKEHTRNRLLICGVGGAGCNMTRHLQMNVKREGIDYLTFDTDKKCLDAVPRGRKILIGESLCRGTGTGRCVEKGKDAALESKHIILKISRNNWEEQGLRCDTSKMWHRQNERKMSHFYDRTYNRVGIKSGSMI